MSSNVIDPPHITPFQTPLPANGQPEDIFDLAQDNFVQSQANYVVEQNELSNWQRNTAVFVEQKASETKQNADLVETSKNQVTAMVGGYSDGNQGSWPTVITTRNDGSALRQGDTFFYTGSTGGGFTKNTAYSWNATLSQWEVAPVPGIFVTKRQIIKTSATWVKPEKFLEGSLLITGTGAGASGCSSGGTGQAGGNAGEWVYRTPVDVSAVSSVSVTIGQGGSSVNGGGTNVAGNPGGATTFGALLTLAGAAATPTSGRAETVGGALGGLQNSSLPAAAAQNNMSAIGGNGGAAIAGSNNSPNGGGGIVVDDSGTKAGDTSSGSGGIGYGAGGGSSTSASTESGAGAPGVLVLEWEERQ